MAKLRVGLTGGIGSGKSAVAAAFAARGATVIDADVLSRVVVRPGSEGLARQQEREWERVELRDRPTTIQSTYDGTRLVYPLGRRG